MYSDGRVFVTFLGLRGVPATLGTVSNISGYLSGPLIEPYPNWSWFLHQGNCDYITNVYRIAVRTLREFDKQFIDWLLKIYLILWKL